MHGPQLRRLWLVIFDLSRRIKYIHPQKYITVFNLAYNLDRQGLDEATINIRNIFWQSLFSLSGTVSTETERSKKKMYFHIQTYIHTVSYRAKNVQAIKTEFALTVICMKTHLVSSWVNLKNLIKKGHQEHLYIQTKPVFKRFYTVRRILITKV